MFRQLDRAQLRADHRPAAGGDPPPAAGPGRRRSSSPPAAVDWLAERGYEPEFGARPLRRTIQREVDNRLSRLLLDGRLRSGQRVRVVVEDGNLDLEVEDVREPASAQA